MHREAEDRGAVEEQPDHLESSTASADTPRRLTALEVAYQVLAAADEPLHSNEIARRALAQNLWTSKGNTPGATVDSRIAVDIQAHGANSRFRRAGRSIFAINQPDSDVIALQPTPLPAPPRATPQTTSATLSFTDAAEQVLQRFGQRQPMHYQEVTRRALELGLIASNGQTPAASMYSMVLTEIDRTLKRGEQPRFAKHGKGMINLAAWEPVGLPAEIEAHNRNVRKQLHD